MSIHFIDYLVFALAFTSANLLTDILRPLVRKLSGKRPIGRPRKVRRAVGILAPLAPPEETS